MENKLFTNWTEEDFTGFWDGKPTKVKAGESILIPAFLAEHFAKHLADRECNRLNKLTDGVEKQEFMKKCIAEITPEEEEEIKVVQVEKAKNKGGRPKKVEAPKMIDHVITQADLDNNPDLVTEGVKVGEKIQIPAVDDSKNDPFNV